MSVSTVFKTVVQPDLERVPVLQVVHQEVVNGKQIAVSHTVRRNVFTEFDRELSRHLAATRGAGFPQISVETRICEDANAAVWRPLRPTSHESVPAALIAIAERAFGDRDTALLTVYQGNFNAAGRRPNGIQREVVPEDVEVMRQALVVAALFGEVEFVEISGDFNMITLAPAGDAMPPLTIDLYNRLVAIPVGIGNDCDRLEGPLYDLERYISGTYEARAYMSRVQRALMIAKEEAVRGFRAAADDRILRFEAALDGRRLEGHRLEAATALIARLKAGLGDNLSGLSEDARITALDWSTAVDPNDHEIHPQASGRTPKTGADWMTGTVAAAAV